MKSFNVDRDLCVRCGRCADVCPFSLLATDEAGFPCLPEKNAAYCFACGHCGAVCPRGALVSPKSGGERAQPFSGLPDPDAATVKKFLSSCRSIRRFRAEPVPQEKITEILESARMAPSAGNGRPVRWIVLLDAQKRELFTTLAMEWVDTRLRHDPVLSALYDADAIVGRYRNGEDPILRGAPGALFAVTRKGARRGPIDATIALSYFCLAAHGLGVGSCWGGFGMDALATFQSLRDLVGLDASMTVQGMVFFGYPQFEYAAVPPRKPLETVWL